MLSYPSFRRGLLFLLPISLTLIGFMQLDELPVFSRYYMLSVFLTCIADTGGNRGELGKNAIIFCLLSIIILMVATTLHVMLSGYSYYLALTLLLFFSQAISSLTQRYLRLFMIAGIFPIVLADFPLPDYSLQTLLLWQNLAVIAGISLSSIIAQLLPTVPLNQPSHISRNLLITKYFRVALAVGTIFMLCHSLSLAHPSWAAISAFVCAELNMGSTIKKSAYRIIGTFMGICLGLPLSYFLFEPFPSSRYLVIPLLTIALIVLERSYMLTIFFATLSLGGIYFAIDPIANNVTWFILDRLLETALGLTIFLVFELIILPKSVLASIRQDSSLFWSELTAFFLQSSAEEQSNHLSQAKVILSRLHQSLENYRYEPLVLMTRKYYYCQRQLKLYQEVLDILEYYQSNSADPKFSALFNQISIQALLPIDKRKIFVMSLFKTINQQNFEHHEILISKIKRVIANIHSTLNSKSYYFA